MSVIFFSFVREVELYVGSQPGQSDEGLGNVILLSGVKLHTVQMLSTWDQSDKPLNSPPNNERARRQVKEASQETIHVLKEVHTWIMSEQAEFKD